MSATILDDLLNNPIMKHYPLEYVNAARAELAQLRATVAAQAKQLREARALIEYVIPSVQPYMVIQLREWIAANAPQMPEEQSA